MFTSSFGVQLRSKSNTNGAFNQAMSVVYRVMDCVVLLKECQYNKASVMVQKFTTGTIASSSTSSSS